MAKRCTPETATRIVNLLRSNCGEGQKLLEVVAPPPPPEPVVVVKPRAKYKHSFKRRGKVTPEMRALIVASGGMTIAEVQDVIMDRLGAVISGGSIYKVWNANARGEVK